MNQKRKPYRNRAILQSARGQECTYNGPICNYDRSTVVFCHSDYSEDGKSMGQKADDFAGFFGCSECHKTHARLIPNLIDWVNINGRDRFHRAMKRTWRILLDMGVIT